MVSRSCSKVFNNDEFWLGIEGPAGEFRIGDFVFGIVVLLAGEFFAIVELLTGEFRIGDFGMQFEPLLAGELWIIRRADNGEFETGFFADFGEFKMGFQFNFGEFGFDFEAMMITRAEWRKSIDHFPRCCWIKLNWLIGSKERPRINGHISDHATVKLVLEKNDLPHAGSGTEDVFLGSDHFKKLV